MRKQNIRARICRCKGNTQAIIAAMQSKLSDTEKTDLIVSLRCQDAESQLTNTYKTLGNFLKRGIPILGCYRVAIFTNPLATYAGYDCILIVANGKIIEEFTNAE